MLPSEKVTIALSRPVSPLALSVVKPPMARFDAEIVFCDGLDGVVICTHGALDRLERRSETHVYVEAGVACARVAKQCIKWGLGPAEFFAPVAKLGFIQLEVPLRRPGRNEMPVRWHSYRPCRPANDPLLS